jgi:hypothetical protein
MSSTKYPNELGLKIYAEVRRNHVLGKGVCLSEFDKAIPGYTRIAFLRQLANMELMEQVLVKKIEENSQGRNVDTYRLGPDKGNHNMHLYEAVLGYDPKEIGIRSLL